jgi:hypothetical protein
VLSVRTIIIIIIITAQLREYLTPGQKEEEKFEDLN